MLVELLNFFKEVIMDLISLAGGFSVWQIQYMSSIFCSFFQKEIQHVSKTNL
jgi:hypothetical protein